MVILKKGSQGALVTELQNILRELDYNIPVTGVFDSDTEKAVKNFQASHLDKHNEPLEVDGKVGDITMWALQNPRNKVEGGAIDYRIMPDLALGGTTIGRKTLEFAISEL